MSDLRELYQEILLEHNSKPRNFRKLPGANRTAEGYNPLCGDQITLYLNVEGDVITDVGFQGAGCAISRASASLMTQSIKGQPVAKVEEIFDVFHRMLTKPGEPLNYDVLGDLEMLSGVAEFPTRIKCAILSWHTLRASLTGQREAASTE
jgi:nitrogen fixation NifU-like protein